MVSLPVPGAVIAGKYELERPLARGGMGSVWVARHRDLDIPVAVKFMAPALIASADARARFEREAKAAAQLDSRHVVQVYDYGIDGGAPYIVMELLKGEDLGHRLARERRLPLPEVAELVSHIAKALRRAHEMQLVHRDLKPANIFLTTKDDEQVWKVLDFGIAKAAGIGLAGPATQTGALIGSVHFMSPEQARRSKEVDFRTDLWALGVIVFRALTGRLPFPGDEIGDVIVKICTEPAAPPSTIVPELPSELDDFFARALSRAPEGRFQSAREMAQSLAEIARLPAFLDRSSATPAPASLPAELGPAQAPATAPLPAGPPALHTRPGTAPTPDSLREPLFSRDLMPVATVELAATLEPTTEKKTDVWHPAPPPGDGSLSPSLQTLHPRAGTRRVLGTAVGLVIVVLIGLAWWTLEEGAQPSAAPAAESTTALSSSGPLMAPHGSGGAPEPRPSVVPSASVAPVITPTGEVSAQPTATLQGAASKQADGRPRLPTPTTARPPAEKRIPLP